MKKYVIFAGVNGAGKTTLYQTNREYFDLPRINLDEIVRGIGSWKNSKDISEAGKIAVRDIRKLFEEEKSFNQETTLCGHSIFRNIDKARIYDNTNKFGIVAVFNNGICVDRIDDIPDWCNGIL